MVKRKNLNCARNRLANPRPKKEILHDTARNIRKPFANPPGPRAPPANPTQNESALPHLERPRQLTEVLQSPLQAPSKNSRPPKDPLRKRDP